MVYGEHSSKSDQVLVLHSLDKVSDLRQDISGFYLSEVSDLRQDIWVSIFTNIELDTGATTQIILDPAYLQALPHVPLGDCFTVLKVCKSEMFASISCEPIVKLPLSAQLSAKIKQLQENRDQNKAVSLAAQALLETLER